MLQSITSCSHTEGYSDSQQLAVEYNAAYQRLALMTETHSFTFPPSPSETKRLRPLKTSAS